MAQLTVPPLLITTFFIAFSSSINAQELRPTEDEAAIKVVRAVYGAIENAELTSTRKELTSEDEELPIAIERMSDESGSVRKIVVDVATGDHGGFAAFVYYYENSNMPAFVLWQDSYWRFNPDNPDESIDFFKEYRFYYSKDGQLLRQLVKEYQGTSDYTIDENAAKAQNRNFTTTGTNPFEFWKNLANLNITTDQFVGKRVEDLLSIFDDMVR